MLATDTPTANWFHLLLLYRHRPGEADILAEGMNGVRLTAVDVEQIHSSSCVIRRVVMCIVVLLLLHVNAGHRCEEGRLDRLLACLLRRGRAGYHLLSGSTGSSWYPGKVEPDG